MTTDRREYCRQYSREYRKAHRKCVTKHNQEYYWANSGFRERKLKRARDLVLEKKLVVLDYYSNGELKCAQCGIDDLDVLSLDHINGGGTKHRKTNPHSYRWAINNDFPDGFQVLCFNCNWKKRINSDN